MKLRFVALFIGSIALYLISTPNFAETKTPTIKQYEENVQKSVDQSIDSGTLGEFEVQRLENQPTVQRPTTDDADDVSQLNHKRKKFVH